jgi:hypothetical protein
MEKQAPQWWITLQLEKQQQQGLSNISAVVNRSDNGATASNMAVATQMTTYTLISHANDDLIGNSAFSTPYLDADTDSAYSCGTSTSLLKEVPDLPDSIVANIDNRFCQYKSCPNNNC